MEARIPELIMLIGILGSLIVSMLILPHIERKEEESRKGNWAIIDREFIDFQEDCNG